jgi:flagellar biogenesis protein FliO
VLGIFFLVAWLMHRLAPQGQTVLPTEVFEVLGHAPLAGRQQVRLLRYGGKLLLVSVTATGAETLGEVTDPVEVDRLTALCRGGAGRAVETLRQAFGQRAAAPGGDLAGTPQRTTRRANGPDALEGRHA